MERYESLGVVGEGSYGIVLKCKNKETGQTVAVKKFLESEEDQNVKKIALREIRMLKRLRHENLINLIEFFRRKKRLYLVFEFVDHTVLDELESKNGGLEPSVARAHIFQVIRGVSFCHENQIIHRDVKPENVLVSRLGVVKLCDFGFARLLGGPDDSCTDYVATRWYRAPELLVGETKYGREVDIWAIGCLLAEMLTGDPLFPGESDIDQLYHIIQTLGELCNAHKNLLTKNPMFTGLRLPTAATKPLASTHTRWDKKTHMFISNCLHLNPSSRPSAEDLLRDDYLIHDNFPDVFMVELKEKVQTEFGTLLPPPRKSSGQNSKKPKRPKGSPDATSNNLPAKVPQSISWSTTQKPMYVVSSIVHPTNSPIASQMLIAPSKYPTNIAGMDTNVNDNILHSMPNKESINNPNLLTTTFTTPSSNVFRRNTIFQRAINLPSDVSPIRQIRKDKSLKSPLSLWLSTQQNQNLSLKGHGKFAADTASNKDAIANDGAVSNLGSFSRHQIDFSRHPYAVSLDRSKDSANRDPLREIKDNKEAKKEIQEKEKKDSYRPPRSGWAKPRLLNDDLFLPTVCNGKPMSPLKLEKLAAPETASTIRSKTTHALKKPSFTMPTLNPIQRSSPSSIKVHQMQLNRAKGELEFDSECHAVSHRELMMHQKVSFSKSTIHVCEEPSGERGESANH